MSYWISMLPNRSLGSSVNLTRIALLFFLITQSWALANAQSTDVVLYASETTVKVGNWLVEADSTAAGGNRIRYPDAGGPRLTEALANPTHYFETTFVAQAGVAYRLWMRGKADANSTNNDSAWVQFSGSVDSNGTPMFRIGTTSATMFNLEDCTGCGLSAWGWNDNLFGGLGPLIYFASSGTQTIRVQLREDGLAIDQIVLSPQTWLNNAPGAPKNDTTILPKTGGGSPITFVRQPYLQRVAGSSAWVVWAARELVPAEVRYWSATPGEPVQSVSATSRVFKQSSTGMAFDYFQYEAQVANLLPGTVYNYDIFVNGQDATPGVVDQLRSEPSMTQPINFVAFGDSGTLLPAQFQIANLIANEFFDLALHAGDIAYEDGTYQQFHDTFFGVYNGWMRSRPVYPCIGNHDDRTSSALPYRELFVLPENGANATFPDHKERYYSFNYGSIHFVALDSELAFLDPARRQAQVNWLSADLANTTQPWRVVFFHRPPYSSGFHGSDLELQQAFGPIFEQRGVQLVINGHEHNYERLVPWRETGPQAVTYVVTGGGGAALREVGRSAFTAVAQSRHHYVRGTISGCQLTLQAVDASGVVFDSYVLDRCSQANDSAPPTVTITQPTAGANVSGVTLVRAQASDDVRVEKVDLWVDGVLSAIDIQAPYEFSWDTTRLPDGSHTIEARTYDIAGKRASSGVRTVNVRNTATTVPEIVLYASETTARAGNWLVEADGTAAGGFRIRYPDAGGPRLTEALANPTHYFETTFVAQAGVAYRLWMRGKADANSTNNDSAWVQFSGSVDSNGTPMFRIGTTSATMFNLEDCTGCGLSAWGWNDNLFGGLGPLIYFASSGTQTIRVQLREDGLAIDQIVLSPQTWLNNSPGAARNDTTILQKSNGGPP